MKKKVVHVSVFCIIIILSIGAVQNPFSINYIGDLKSESQMVLKHQDPLYEEISARSESYMEPALDARIDRVWKAVPGYNGLEVDVEASYDKMKKLGVFDESRLVFTETSPNVHLDDLPPSGIYKGNEHKPMVTFLVNVAWGNEYLPEMLKTLKKYDLHTTFFLDGSWVKSNPSLAMMLFEEGHEIGNHAYSHPDMSKLTIARIDEEIMKTNQVIKATIDVTPKWFAPPSGSFNQTVVEQAAKQGMKTVLWSVDTVDWRKPNHLEMVERVLGKVHNGAMILMHPTEPTAKGLESLINGIQAKGYHIGTVSELLSEERITLGVTLDDNRGINSDNEN
ncbi:polysaccharide deacetylase family protein [Halalkalibacter nanhaiisediminis]|uniref:Putative sporulation protein (Polysaccharide deacetylase family) n=1 Tax=Halalkalibacter nanhaiisediminis TaxID=688079 RepID=A0A562QEM8_9BACI|nr:polysaccharide deacetylase family protein [Halalkalibacter nanhaiisediminis]TWI55208.1 putative sporulation protein (polysaccharide deacetylase family) [Halalkalibacter nanhaiisediminis]